MLKYRASYKKTVTGIPAIYPFPKPEKYAIVHLTKSFPQPQNPKKKWKQAMVVSFQKKA